MCFIDDGDENLNDHEDGSSKENYREQDIYLPIANVARIMKNAVPQTGKVCDAFTQYVIELTKRFLTSSVSLSSWPPLNSFHCYDKHLF